MLNGNYVSVDRIISSVYRDFKFNTEINWIDCIEWIGECLADIGTAGQYVEKVTDGNTELGHADPIIIENYRGRIPSDIVYIMQAWNCETKQSMDYSTDSFHTSYYCEGYTKCCSGNDTYKLNNEYIFTSFESGTVQLAYRAFPTDSDGLPLVPDNQAFVNACKYAIARNIALQLWTQDKMDNAKFQYFDQQRDWYIAQATSKANMPNYDRMQNLQNIFTSLIPQLKAKDEKFSRIANLEQRYNSSYR